jgi:hypothetical protein
MNTKNNPWADAKTKSFDSEFMGKSLCVISLWGYR